MYSYLFLVIISINKFSFNRIQCILCKTLLLNFKRICNRYTSLRNTDQYSSSPRSSLFLLYTLIYFSLEYGKYPQTAKLPATINSIKTFVNQSSYTRTQTQTPLRISVSLSNYPNKPFPSNFQLLNHKQPTFASNHPFPKIKQSRLPIVRNANLVNKPSSREPFSTKPFSLPPSTILPNSIFVFLETLVYSCNKTGQSGGSKDIGRTNGRSKSSSTTFFLASLYDIKFRLFRSVMKNVEEQKWNKYSVQWPRQVSSLGKIMRIFVFNA